jgi:hypothetical protein
MVEFAFVHASVLYDSRRGWSMLLTLQYMQVFELGIKKPKWFKYRKFFNQSPCKEGHVRGYISEDLFESETIYKALKQQVLPV